jgi:hypothetical protein
MREAQEAQCMPSIDRIVLVKVDSPVTNSGRETKL